jgi:TRAP-type uncharacterized transport system substrate-binding protein
MAWLYQHKWLYIRLPVAVLGIAVIAWLWLYVYPMPPDKLSITTAGKDGAYFFQGKRYAQSFAAHGVALNVQTSEGSQENLERLRSTPGQSDLAMMQGGFGYLGETAANREISRIETLANIDVEAVWIFSVNRSITSLDQLNGLKIAVGPERSGSRKVALKLFEQAKIDLKTIGLSQQMGLESVQALEQGIVDVVFLVAPRESSTIQNLLNIPGVQLGSLNKSAAIVERNPYLDASLLPQGALGTRLPSRDTAMLTMSTSLVARQDLHPALKRLAISVAMEVHTDGGLFHRAGDFPSLRRIDFPTAPNTRFTLTQGLPFHERLLPFWWAQFVERLVLLVLPVILMALWLMLQIPNYVRWLLQNRVNRWYGALKFIENDLSQEKITGMEMARFLASLNNIDKALLAFHCPKDLMARCYTLHQHIEFVRQRLYRMRGR